MGSVSKFFGAPHILGGKRLLFKENTTFLKENALLLYQVKTTHLCYFGKTIEGEAQVSPASLVDRTLPTENTN